MKLIKRIVNEIEFKTILDAISKKKLINIKVRPHF